MMHKYDEIKKLISYNANRLEKEEKKIEDDYFNTWLIWMHHDATLNIMLKRFG